MAVSNPKTIDNLTLAGYDDIFNVNSTLKEGEVIVEMPLDELYPPDFHPFQVNNDLSMQRLARNIKRRGVRRPGVVRVRSSLRPQPSRRCSAGIYF